MNYTTTRDGMRRYTLQRLYIPTGERSEGTFDAWNDEEALRLVNRYNEQMPGRWQYWLGGSRPTGWGVG